MSEPAPPSFGASFDALVTLIARLRAPGGCPWDREQTHESLKSMTIEEAYEVVEAIDHSDKELCAELGDLLLQVVYHAQIASEGERFAAGDVITSVMEKMIRRHPHVFGEMKAESSTEVLRNWEALKAAERSDEPKSREDASMLDSVSKALPAVMESYQMSTKVGRVGFDWPDRAAVLSKLEEEVREVREALEENASHGRVQDEIGDLLFAAVNLARLSGVDPESALKSTNRKFRRRFAHVETELRAKGSTPAESNLAEMEALWSDAKTLEGSTPTKE